MWYKGAYSLDKMMSAAAKRKYLFWVSDKRMGRACNASHYEWIAALEILAFISVLNECDSANRGNHASFGKLLHAAA